MSNEPVAIGSAVVAFFNAVLAVVSIAVEISPELIASLNAAMVALVVLVGSIVRSKVTPVDS